MRYEVELTDEQAQSFERTWSKASRERHISVAAPHAAAYALADAIRAQMPKPHMDEPGWGGSVVAHIRGGKRVTWLHYSASWWSSEQYGTGYGWSDLIDPQPVDGAQ